jgi:hypothetical protein
MIIQTIDETTGEGIELCGDVSFRLINSKNKKMICRFAMNTSFVDNITNKYIFDKKGVDPDSIMKNKKFKSEFSIHLSFQDSCIRCKPNFPVDSLCNSCKSKMKI